MSRVYLDSCVVIYAVEGTTAQQERVHFHDPFFLPPRFEVAPFNRSVFDLAAELRAKFKLKTPDALHVAAARASGCDEFWTNDRRLPVLGGRTFV